MPADSVFASRTLEDLYGEIRRVYLSDNRPWILGFSGGKDSTCMVQMIWSALSSLPPEKLHKRIYIISSDTLGRVPQGDRADNGHARHDGEGGGGIPPAGLDESGAPPGGGQLLGLPARKGVSRAVQHVPVVHRPPEDQERRPVHPAEGLAVRRGDSGTWAPERTRAARGSS